MKEHQSGTSQNDRADDGGWQVKVLVAVLVLGVLGLVLKTMGVF